MPLTKFRDSKDSSMPKFFTQKIIKDNIKAEITMVFPYYEVLLDTNNIDDYVNIYFSQEKLLG